MQYVYNDFFLDVARGRIRNHSNLHKFGENQGLTTADTEEDIWTNGGTYAFPSDSGIAMEVVSSNAGDTHTVTVIGLDENFDEQEVQATLTGTTPVTISGTWTRVFRMYNDSDTASLGSVSVRDDATSTTTYAIYTADHQQTMMTIYTVPAGHTLYVMKLEASAEQGGAAGNVEVKFDKREFGKIFRTQEHFTVQTTGSSFALRDFSTTPLKFDAKTDLKMIATGSTNNMAISASFDGILIHDTPH